jgi:26S proteasome regulatory subunit N1
MSPVALGGILTTLFGFIDIDSTIHKDSHYLLFYLTCAIQPRMLVTLNENLEQIEVPVRVGQAVDIVG